MNLKAVYEEVGRMVDLNEAYCIKLEVWCYDRPEDPVIKVTVWDGRRHYEGATPEEALAAFRASRLPLAALAAVEVPEAGG